MERNTTLIPLSMVAALGLCLSGCGTAATSTTTTTTSATTTTTTATVSVTPTATAPTGTTKPAEGPVEGCVNTDLALAATEDPGGTGAGSRGVLLTVSNIGSKPCHLQENTTVLMVSGPEKPAQIGSAAAYDPPGTSPALVLPAGGKATTSLRITQSDNIQGCQPQSAWALAIATAPQTFVVAPLAGLTGCADGNKFPMHAKAWQQG